MIESVRKMYFCSYLNHLLTIFVSTLSVEKSDLYQCPNFKYFSFHRIQELLSRISFQKNI